MPFRKWIKSANYAIEGILHGAKTQRHLRYHFLSAAAALFFSYMVGVSNEELIIISLAVILVLGAEMMNSAIEAVVDLVSPDYSEKARIAKDIAAGAVLITAFGAALVGYVVLFPYVKTISLIAFILVVIAVIITKAYFGKGLPLSGGMPSGHSALAFSVWVSVTFISENVYISMLCFLLAVWIAQSRLAVRAHTIWEVILGAVMGATLTFLLFRLFY
jgi:diacylglycerol kinase (ATP)